MKNNSGFASIVILAVVFAVAIGGVWIYSSHYKKENAIPHTPISFKVFSEYQKEDGLVEYHNNNVGFAFSYPRDWGEPEIISSKDRLYISFQDIYFTDNDFTVKASPRGGCEEGDDYRIGLGGGYIVKNGEYFTVNCGYEENISRAEVKVVETMNTEAVVWTKDCAVGDCEDKFIFAEINLPNPKFPGVGVSMAWKPRIEVDKSVPLMQNQTSFDEMQIMFESVIKTFVTFI